MPRWLKLLLLAMAFLLVAAIPLARQLATGSIEGTVMDGRGPVVNASVEARNLVSGLVENTESDAGGHYVIERLRPGVYSLWVEAAGHDSVWIPKVVVEAGQSARQDVQLNQMRFGFSGS